MSYHQNYLKRSICLAMLMGSTLPVAPSFAQEFTLEEVIVTARKQEESVNDIPVAVTAMSGDQMESLQAFDPTALSQYVPGLTVIPSSTTPIYTIRGVGFNSGLTTSTGTVGISHDQATLPFPAMSRGMVFDVERVEVLKGPQGTLYGRSTTGGQINYIMNKPTDDFESSVMVEGGSYASWGIEGFVSGPIVGDSLRGRLSLKTKQSDKGWQRSVSSDRTNGEEDRSSGRLILDFTPNDALQTTLTYSYWEDKSDVLAGQNIQFAAEVEDGDLDINDPEAVTEFLDGFSDPFERAAMEAQINSVRPGRDWDSTSAEWPDVSVYQLDPARFSGPYNQNTRPFPGINQKQHMADFKVQWDFADDMSLISQTTYVDYENDTAVHGSASTIENGGGRNLSDLQTLTTELRLTGLAFDEQLSYQVGTMWAKDDLLTRGQVYIQDTGTLYGFRDLASGLAGLWQLIYDLDQNFPGIPIIGPLIPARAPLGDPPVPNSLPFQQWEDAIVELDALRLSDPAAAAALLGTRPSAADIANAGEGFRTWEAFNDVESTTWAVFAHGQYEINEEWTLETGIRYTDVDAENRACTRDVDADFNIHSSWNFVFFNPVGSVPNLADGSGDPRNAPAAGECFVLETTRGVQPGDDRIPVDANGRPHDLDEDNTSVKIALDYRPNDDIMYYGSFAVGYKAGSFNTTSAFTSVQLEPVVQEKVTAYELGFKWSAHETVHWNASVYFYEYEDKQLGGTIPDEVFTTLTSVVNVPESEVWGVETDITWAPNANWFFTANAAYLNTEITEYIGYDPENGEEVDLSGFEFALSPEVQFTLLASYNTDIADNWNLRINADMSYTSAQVGALGAITDIFDIDAYTILGLSANLSSHDGLWETQLWGRNIMDTYYWTGVGAALDTATRGVGIPRTWGLTVRRNF